MFKRTRILKYQVGDIAIGLQFTSTKEPTVSLARIAHTRSHVLCAVPRNVIKLDGFLVILMTISTEL